MCSCKKFVGVRTVRAHRTADGRWALGLIQVFDEKLKTPPDRSHTVPPSNLYFRLIIKTLNEYMGANANLCELSADSESRLTQAGIGDGQDLKHTVHYTNYVLFGTPPRRMCGTNVHRLREIGKQYDPHRVMEVHHVHRTGSPISLFVNMQ